MTTKTADSEMKSTVVWLTYKLDLHCPYCYVDIDFMDRPDEESDITKMIFNNNWDAVEGMKMGCSFCEREFTIDKIEY